MEHTGWLQVSLIYLGAAVLAVPLARALGLGSIIGYLVAGVAIGPWGLRLVTDAQTILSVAEFGVVLMLFMVGLELEPRRLWALRRPIFGWGSVQVGASALLMAALGLAIQDKLPDAEIKSRLERLREKRREAEASLTKAQEELRAVLSIRQEAVAGMFGVLS